MNLDGWLSKLWLLGPECRTPMAFEKALWNRGSASEVGRTLGAALRTTLERTQRLSDT